MSRQKGMAFNEECNRDLEEDKVKERTSYGVLFFCNYYIFVV